MRLNIRFPGATQPLSGWTVLIAIVAFFAVIIAVNATMATLAITTFGGVEARNAYQAGLSFSREIAAARAQEARNWRVEAKLSPWTPEGVTVDVSAKDAAGLSVAGVEFTATFAHPVNRRQDRTVPLSVLATGAFRGSADVSPGQWDLVVEATRDEERLFRSKSRVRVR